jgi:alpha-beta hydrolase superfamily lysophospholipase
VSSPLRRLFAKAQRRQLNSPGLAAQYPPDLFEDALWCVLVRGIPSGHRARQVAGLILIPMLILQAAADTVVKPEAQHQFYSTMNQMQPGSCSIKSCPHRMFR